MSSIAEAVRAKEGERGAVRFDDSRRCCSANLARLARRTEKLGATGLGQRRGTRRGTGGPSYCCYLLRFILDAGCCRGMERRRFRFVLARAGLFALCHGHRHLRGAEETNARVACAVGTPDGCVLARDGPLIVVR